MNSQDLAEGPEAKKLREWFDAEKKKGLVDIKFDGGLGIAMSGKKPSLEQACKDVNDLIALSVNGEAIEILSEEDLADDELF